MVMGNFFGHVIYGQTLFVEPQEPREPSNAERHMGNIVSGY